jgi:hypothetical protein
MNVIPLRGMVSRVVSLGRPGFQYSELGFPDFPGPISNIDALARIVVMTIALFGRNETRPPPITAPRFLQDPTQRKKPENGDGWKDPRRINIFVGAVLVEFGNGKWEILEMSVRAESSVSKSGKTGCFKIIARW